MSAKINSNFRPLQIASEERSTHGLRYGDYTRYRKHCARKTHRLRSSLKMTHGKGREFKKLPQIMPENAKEGHLQLLLFETERAWAHAQELNADDDHRSTSRYRRSHWHLSQLLLLAESPKLAISLTPEASSEFIIFGLIHTARFNLRRVPRSTAGYYGLEHEPVFGGSGTIVPYPLIHLSIAYALLEELEKTAQTSKEVAFARAFKDDIAPEIRWCVHEFETSPSYPEDGRLVQLASKWKKREWDIEGIVKDIAPVFSTQIIPVYDDLVQKLRAKATISDRKNVLEELVWEEKPVPVRNPEMVDVLLKVQDSLHKHKSDGTGDALDSKTRDGARKATRGRLAKYDSVLLSLSDAVDEARKLVEAQQASGTSSSVVGVRDIVFMHSVLTYLHLTYRIERDLILVSAIPDQSDTSSSKSSEGVSAQSTVSRLHLLSGILQSLTQTLTLPIVDESADISTGLSLRMLHVKAERTLHLAQIYAHVTQRRYAEAVTLTQRGQLQVREAKTVLSILARNRDSRHLHFYPINDAVIEEMEEKLVRFEEKCKREWFAYNGGVVGERNPEDKYEKPVFFDIALNYVEPPMEQLRRRAGLPVLQSETMSTMTTTKAKVETEGQAQPVTATVAEDKTKAASSGGLAGFLGSWWGRK